MVHQIVILGGGVGGTLLANLLSKKVRATDAQVTVIDATGRHVYQPGWLYIPFGEEKAQNLVKSERRLLRKGVNLIVGSAERIDAARQTVVLANGSTIAYDTLVIGTGADLAPDAVPGYADGAHHFYSAEAAYKLKGMLETFEGGKLVIGVADIPYKCPPAPLEFAFLVEDYLTKKGVRAKTEITYLSPINRVFTIEAVSDFVTPLLEERGIAYQTFFNTESIDPLRKTVLSMEGDEISYDLLVLVPPHRGATVVQASGLGDAQGWLPTDRHTLQVKDHPHIYALGDATDVPVSKSGSAAHFEAKVLANRIAMAVNPLKYASADVHYDGRVLCFLETGHGQASQIVFDFDHPPQPPAPNAFYHYEKVVFNKAYWYIVPNGIV